MFCCLQLLRSGVSKSRLLCMLTPVAVLAANPARGATIIADEQFSDNERATQSLPGSLAWTVGAHHSTDAYGSLNASSGKLVLDHTNGSVRSYAATWAYFTPSGSPATLAVNDRLTLTADVSFSGGAFSSTAGAFRWALFNSGGSRVTSDFAGTNATGISSGSSFSGYTGYEGQMLTNSATPSPTAKNLLTRERTGTSGGLFTSSNWTSLTGSGANESAVVADTVYPLSLVLTRTAAGMEVQASFGAKSTVLVTDSTPVTSFDTIAFFTLEELSHDITFDNILLTTQVVPEPSSLGVAAVAAAGLLARRRRRV